MLIQLVICPLILIDPQRLSLPISVRSRYERMVTRSSWGSLCSPGGAGEEARREPGLGETNVRPSDPVGLCKINLDIDRVSIF